ncbi:aminopeptidase N [Bombina bombina]|uniref:aminopeptidase N n=1 Tax=Bombina bombina TaxID=8345 RepID=UPI00235A4999|nr:aminopeptidase N [Bombina bombina]
MAKGFYVSKLIAVVGILFSVAAVATIIALAVVYSQEKGKNVVVSPSETRPTVLPTSSITSAPQNSTTGSTLSSTTTAPVGNETWHKFRLPKSLIPQHYDIELKPYLEENTEGLYIFEGKSAAFFLCNETTNLVVIHSKKLNYTLQSGHHVILKNEETGSNVPLTRTFLEVPTQYLVVEVAENLQPGKQYSLHTVFQGELADDLAGFYRSEYTEDGVKKIIATTQMQAPDARKAFPCFDEPAMKATFNITLIHKPEYKAISNMPAISSTAANVGGVAWNTTMFARTPKMSTYLLAFIVSDFDYIEAPNNGSQVQVQIWGRKKIIKDQGQYALNVTRPILEFFEKYYSTPYPLVKSDQIALPDFNAGAMENWGLVTYRETALLFDPAVSSIGNKERVVTVIAHELAHQWFGNLVTIRWWNDLWLNEGFASYVEYLGAHEAEKEWNIKDLTVLNDVHRVMAVDALTSSHPLTSSEDEVNTPAEISELFDSIAYSKGASVIRMLSEFLTEPIFVKGLEKYLKAFSYDNTVYSDLWFHLQNAVNEESVNLPLNVSEIMDTWVLQMGFPVVTIDTTTGNINQKHFLLDPDAVVTRPSPYNYVWKVPITFTKTSSTNNIWLLSATDTNSMLKTSGNDWVLANINVTGYYRVNYDDGNWNKLLQELQNNHEVIPLINRAQIIDDAFNLARAKYIITTKALDTTKFLSKEVEYMPWQAALGSLSYFVQMFDRTEVYGPMRQYMKQQVTPLFNYFENKTMNWTERPVTLMEQYNEINSISTACAYGVPQCGKLASDLLSQWMATSTNRIHPNLRSTIYCNAVAQGGEGEWNFIWQEFSKVDNAQEADKLRAALSCSKEPWILNRLLDYSLDSLKIRRQDSVSTITNVASNVIGQSLAWDFVRAKWKIMVENFGTSSFSFGNLIQGVTRRFSTELDLRQLEQFKIDNQNVGFGTATRALEQAIERTKANIKWVNENKEPVQQWFKDAVTP